MDIWKAGDKVRFNWKRREDEFWQLNEYHCGTIDYISDGGIVINDAFFDYADDMVDLKPIKSEADKLRDEQIEKIYKAGDGGVSEATAEIQYEAGCRMTRKINSNVAVNLWNKTGISDADITVDRISSFAKAIAAYVRGEMEL